MGFQIMGSNRLFIPKISASRHPKSLVFARFFLALREEISLLDSGPYIHVV
jgi:hypothetical protein